jgi:ribosomal protein L11 methylase PrmA
MNEAVRDGGSFRDPGGHIYHFKNEVLRAIGPRAAQEYDAVAQTGLFSDLRSRGLLIDAEEAREHTIAGFDRVLRHPRLAFISYPYEWSFPLLKDAALLHLDIQIEALAKGVGLSDATAYNIQFDGTRPLFIDVLSFRLYRDGEHWIGHRQFCEQFLNPLLLRSKLGLAHNTWFRGNLEGIPGSDLALLLPFRSKLSPTIQTNVLLPAKLQARATRISGTGDARHRPLSLQSYRNILLQLQHFIRGLQPRDTGPTVWGRYAEDNTYQSAEEAAKRAFVSEFISKVRPKLVYDFGCNTGAYSEVALESGASNVIGFDFDQLALERAYHRAADKKLSFTPLFQDAANQSPDQGWAGEERKGLGARGAADALLALAFEHHLAIGRNVPLPLVLKWIVAFAPTGVIEFVPKSDTTIRKMLALREDIFPDYTLEEFEQSLSGYARIVRSHEVSAEGRRLYWFDRT